MEFVATRHVVRVARVLVRLVQDEVCILVDQLLHVVLNEFVERVKLLSD